MATEICQNNKLFSESLKNYDEFPPEIKNCEHLAVLKNLYNFC